jgi:transcriptional regulator with XRE-family HTH domain
MEGSDSLGSRLKRAREAAGLEQAEVAERLGVDPMTVSRWERGKHSIKSVHVTALARLYRVPLEAISSNDTLDENVSHETPDRDPFAPDPALARNIPERAYRIVLGYLERLERAGVSVDQLEQMERLLLDDRFAKQYSRRHNVEWTDEDHILHVESLWQAIRDALATQGVVP